ncbi:hypothetical protein [Sulfitobacter sp.]|uniref:hypothetical protein n=1 Tax=Sulfitobacter sp. TaxID=1903071 RepID=UPI00356399D2
MREISLSDGPSQIRANYISELEIYSVYPEDEASREQALFLLRHEYERWKVCGVDDYKPSELVRTLITSHRGNAARRFVCGITAIAMCALQNAGHRVSLNAAAEIVTEFNNSVGKLPFTFWDGLDWVAQEKALLGDTQKIKQAFRQYRSVSHILAAWVVSSEYLNVQQPFDRGLEADACLLHTSAYFQARLKESRNFDDWDLWHIRADPPFDMETFPPFELSENLLHWLIGPWLQRLEG